MTSPEPRRRGGAEPGGALPAELIEYLRADLRDAGFTVDQVVRYLGPTASAALQREQTVPAERVTRSHPGPTATLVRFFTLGLPVSADELDRSLPRVGVAGLQRLGLLGQPDSEPSAGQRRLTARWDVRPYTDGEHNWWVVSDHGVTVTRQPLGGDHVVGVGPASLTLASWTPRRSVERALDLGAGSGVQTLHLAGHARQVIATDVSPAARTCARLTEALAGQRWDYRLGDLFAPVDGERFDLIVSNPPYVITPRTDAAARYTYRDAGRAGDGFLAALVAGLEEHLRPGGLAQILGNWQIAPGDDWRSRWQEWLAGSGLDAWVVLRHEADPAEYAETWLRDGGKLPGDQAAPVGEGSAGGDLGYRLWLDDFAARGVERVAFGVATFQRPIRARPAWREYTVADGPVSQPMGPAVLAVVHGQTWLAEHDTTTLLATPWRCADDVTLERHARPWLGPQEQLLLRQGGGLRRSWALDEVTAALVGVCDGELAAGPALTAIASLLETDAAAVLARALPVLRDLVGYGVLVQGSGS